LPGKAYTFVAEVQGKRNKKFAHDKVSIVRDCIAKEILTLKLGTEVIIVANDKKGHYVNGSRGIVAECCDTKGKQYVAVTLKDTGETHKLKRYN
jgi:hypothetical protein